MRPPDRVGSVNFAAYPQGFRAPPAGHEAPTETQCEVLMALNPDGPTHVAEVAAAVGIAVGTTRQRLYKLDRKHLVICVPDDLFCNRWVLTELGLRTRERLMAGGATA